MACTSMRVGRRGAGGSKSYLKGGSRPHHVSIVQDQGSSDSIVLVVNEELLLVAGEGAHGQQELGQVVAVQRAGLSRQPTGQVCVTHTYHPLQRTPTWLIGMTTATVVVMMIITLMKSNRRDDNVDSMILCCSVA